MSLPNVLLTISGLLALAVLLGVLAERVRLPVTVVLAVVGFIASWLGGMLGIERPLRGAAFEEVVVLLFLPVLVFEAAHGLSSRAFFRNLGPILVLAIPALGISAVLVGVTLSSALGMSLASAFLFGALISATDPVAVVAVFRQLGVPQRLLSLVEGESLLNDGVAIVLFEILLVAALGGVVSISEGVIDFFLVFFGGTAVGVILGLAAAFALPWLDRLSAAALSVAVAYGGFVLADHVFGFSGVMTTLAAGMVLSGMAPSRASAPIREMWNELWEALGYVANALLFLLIGLTIDPALLTDNLAAIGLAIIVVLVARALAVIPLVWGLERFARIPRVGLRNEAVLIWGGLRGGVALALALALPEELVERDIFIAMTGGVVLGTLLINATTIGALVRRLGLDRPSRCDQFLAGSARLSGVEAARQRLAELGLDEPIVSAELDALEHATHEELARIELTDDEEQQVVTRRGLFVERETYQTLSDAGLLPPAATRTLLHEVDDQIEEMSLGWTSKSVLLRRQRPPFHRMVERFTGWLPQPLGEDPAELAYSEASARRLAARRTAEALNHFERLPNIKTSSVAGAKETFARWEREALDSLSELSRSVGQNSYELQRRQAEALSRVASSDALHDLVKIGLLPEIMAQCAAQVIEAKVSEHPRGVSRRS